MVGEFEVQTPEGKTAWLKVHLDTLHSIHRITAWVRLDEDPHTTHFYWDPVFADNGDLILHKVHKEKDPKPFRFKIKDVVGASEIHAYIERKREHELNMAEAELRGAQREYEACKARVKRLKELMA